MYLPLYFTIQEIFCSLHAFVFYVASTILSHNNILFHHDVFGHTNLTISLFLYFYHPGQYFAASMLLVSMSLVLNVVVVTVFSKSNSGEPVPIWLRTLVIHILAPLVRVKTGDLAKMNASRKRHKNKSRFFRSGREMEFERVPNDVRPSGLAFETTDVDANEKNLMDYAPNNSMDRLESIALELRRVNEMLANIGHTNPSAGTPKTPEEKKNERAWVVTARVLDRVFLVLYLIGNVLSLLMLVFQILHIGEPHGEESLCHDGSDEEA